MMDSHQTFIERFNDADEEEQKKIARLINGAGYASERAGRTLVVKKRAKLASQISFGEMSHIEATKFIEEREDEFVEEYNDLGLPEWVLRIEAQDTLMQLLIEKMEEEGLLD